MGGKVWGLRSEVWGGVYFFYLLSLSKINIEYQKSSSEYRKFYSASPTCMQGGGV
jgi:hypothetical protein